ncbi:hypothetical protein Krac_5042 [Ktedonobacter racemifer DSM 44963]|uniref:Uncharacterized protein n=1 Tax=Ktedonobacter racemifer DSM 44963 TaxID=485913 RepID=D6TUG3_KTERA|nr:hypothetical protein Krac_5042 [Ktedonobacter racemifer DSM 44963]
MDSIEKQIEDFAFVSDLALPVAREITRPIAEGARGAGGRPSGCGRLCVGSLEVLRALRQRRRRRAPRVWWLRCDRTRLR